MFFDRKIKYLDYMENKERIRGAGFVKIEVRDSACNLLIQVNGMHVTDNFVRKVLLVGEKEEYPLCEISLVQGKGSIQMSRLDSRNLGGSGISYLQLYGIRIPIAAGKEIYCVVREWEKERQPEMVQSKEELIYESVEQTEPSLQLVNEPITTVDIGTEAENQPITSKELQESKWGQLTSIYPHIRPFRDERDYLSIGPGDFVILTEKYYGMANNSFLLHGYYNYKHLILSRLEKRGNATYYIGVPGNFYEREKQVALLFGFESFESGEEPAQAGDYGYYMMKVEL